MKFENDTELMTALDNLVANYDHEKNRLHSKEVLVASRNRLRELLSASPVQTLGILKAGVLNIDLDKRRASIAGAEINFTPKEYKLLVYIARHKNKMLPVRQILKDVWGVGYEHQAQLLRVSLGMVRRKLGTHANLIKTFPGEGYILEDAA